MGELAGLYAAMATPVDGDGRLLPDLFAAHAQRLLELGCDGVVVFGSTGEAPSFSVPERQGALEELISRGLKPERIILGAGCCALADTLALIRHGLELGVRRFLTIPPFYFKPLRDEGVYRAYAALAEALADSPAELLLYHYPQMSGVPISAEVIARLLADHPGRFVGIKDSGGDFDHSRALKSRFPELKVFTGNDKALWDAHQAGLAGAITAGLNLLAAPARGLWDALLRGDRAEAERHMRLIESVRALFESLPMIPAIKSILAWGLEDPSWHHLRPPFAPLTEAESEALEAELVRVGFDPVRALAAQPGDDAGRAQA